MCRVAAPFGLMSVKDAAKAMGVSRGVLDRLCREGLVKRYLPRCNQRGYLIDLKEAEETYRKGLVEA